MNITVSYITLYVEWEFFLKQKHEFTVQVPYQYRVAGTLNINIFFIFPVLFLIFQHYFKFVFFYSISTGNNYSFYVRMIRYVKIVNMKIVSTSILSNSVDSVRCVRYNILSSTIVPPYWSSGMILHLSSLIFFHQYLFYLNYLRMYICT